MRYNLKLFLFTLGILLAAPATINSAIAQKPSLNLASSQLVAQSNHQAQLIAQNATDREIRAFLLNKKYDYWDARVLAHYWGQSIDDAKARMGRKILWGTRDQAILDQFLLDARVKALQANPNDIAVKFYRESRYKYRDAENLAKFWGDRSPWDAKIRIGRNLILGQEDVVERAVQLANQKY